MRKYSNKYGNEKNLFYWITTLLPVYVGIVAIFLGFYTIYSKHKKDILEPIIGNYKSEEIYRLKNIINNLTSKIDDMGKRIDVTPENKSEIAINNKLINIEDKINDIDQKTIALRQAINPFKPEEMLTIARLKDEVMIVRKKMDENYEIQKREQDSFRNAVARELDASARSTYLIVAILVPLALTFSYTVWNDRREKKKDKISKQEKAE